MSWKKIVLLNVASIAGCFLALYTVPPQTPLRTFLLACAGAMILLNVSIIYYRRRKTPTAAPGETPRKRRYVVAYIGTAIFFLEILFHFMKK